MYDTSKRLSMPLLDNFPVDHSIGPVEQVRSKNHGLLANGGLQK
jgi:hypothetical protein